MSDPEQALSQLLSSLPGATGDIIREHIADLQALLQTERHGLEDKRWNVHKSGEGKIQICFGNHDRGTACQYVNYAEVKE